MERGRMIFIILTVVALCYGNAYAGFTSAFIDVAVDNGGQAIAIFQKKDGTDGEVEKIRLDYVTKKNELAMSDFIYPTYVGINTKVFILPKEVTKSRFNITVHTSEGKANYVSTEMKPLK